MSSAMPSYRQTGEADALDERRRQVHDHQTMAQSDLIETVLESIEALEEEHDVSASVTISPQRD